jgi:hypothetical protein
VIKHKRLLVILALVGISLATPLVLFFARSPVLIVTDAPFAALHGASHLRGQQISASRTLFRRVKPVKVADGVSPDMVILAVTEVSRQPFCVLFPHSHAEAARFFHERFPEVSVVLLSGVYPVSNLPPLDGFFCAYHTDSETDLYRAGLFAGILGGLKRTDHQEAEKPAGTYVLQQNRLLNMEERELFSQGIKEQDPEAVIIDAYYAGQVPDTKGIDAMVLSGGGGDFLEKNPRIPVILFSWLDPALIAGEVVIQFDDSAWALAVPAVRLAEKREAEGKIPSKPLIFPRKIADKNILRLLEK